MSNKIMLNIGFGNSVERAGIRVIVQPNSAPIKRYVKQKQVEGLLIDATMGKKLRAVIVMESGQVVLSAISVASLILRVEDE
jgi:extracellular matrix regulatory protein A